LTTDANPFEPVTDAVIEAVPPPEIARLADESDNAKSGEVCCPPPFPPIEPPLPQPTKVLTAITKARHVDSLAPRLKRTTSKVFMRRIN
jgi:hypothetical protein